MGFYLRKSIKVGPVRFNLSKSGVGISAGFKGLRFGTGPRGNYVHVGRYGLYYRATIPSYSSTKIISKPTDIPKPEIPPDTHEPLQDIVSANAAQIIDSSSEELLKEIDKKRRKIRLWPSVSFLTISITLIGVTLALPIWLLATFFIGGCIGVYFAYQRDILSKTVVIFYDFDTEMENAYNDLIQSIQNLSRCARAWFIEAEGRVHDRKYHAGASKIIRRKLASIKKSEPPYVKTNIETFSIGLGKQVLHLFPDRIFIFETDSVGAVSYNNLQLSVQPSRFIEDEGVPNDAKIVDYTWRYVNKNGAPDKRFKNNYRLPICLYDEISLYSPTGLNKVIQISRYDLGEGFVKAIKFLASKMPTDTLSHQN